MDQRAPAPTLAEALLARGNGALALKGVRVPAALFDGDGPVAGDGLVRADLTLRGDRVTLGAAPDAQTLDAGGRIVWPRTVDCHSHLDKGQTAPRSPNPDGTFDRAGEATTGDRARHFSADDLRRRAEFQLRAAHSSGTKALRSHVDADPATMDATLGILSELASDWAGCVDVQLCPFTGALAGTDSIRKAAEAAQNVGGALSLYLYDDPGLPAALDAALGMADRLGLPLDIHADETLDPGSHCLRALAEAVLRTGFRGPVLAGHACALMVQSAEEADRTMDMVARAGIGIVSLPLCNAYLMDRHQGRTPRVRGGTLVHEMRARGIPVAFGSDNVRDGYYAYGDLDMVELYRHAARTLQLDHPVGDWPAAVAAKPAQLIGYPGGRIRPNMPADLILFEARNWTEFLARPQTGRIVLDRGDPVDTTPPPYSDLDDLKGMSP